MVSFHGHHSAPPEDNSPPFDSNSVSTQNATPACQWKSQVETLLGCFSPSLFTLFARGPTEKGLTDLGMEARRRHTAQSLVRAHCPLRPPCHTLHDLTTWMARDVRPTITLRNTFSTSTLSHIEIPPSRRHPTSSQAFFLSHANTQGSATAGLTSLTDWPLH